MIVFNFVAIKAGGGQQNALSFLSAYANSAYLNRQITVFSTAGSAVNIFCKEKHINHIAIRGGILNRLFFELIGAFLLFRKGGYKVVFSIFGSSPLFCPGIYRISGFAYSNILQPEIDFWSHLPTASRIKHHIIDRIRAFQARRSNEIILETDFLKEKARIFFKDQKLHVIKMAPSLLVTAKSQLIQKSKRETIDITYLAGAHPNKRIHLLADIFVELAKFSKRFRLITTLPTSHPYTESIRKEFRIKGISEAFHNIGPVRPENVAQVLANSDALINIALLESFSNNWVEAWATKIPLIATDADWARASCGDAALYIDPTKPQLAASKIIDTMNNPGAIQNLLKNGELQLKSLPTAEMKFQKYMSIINASTERLTK